VKNNAIDLLRGEQRMTDTPVEDLPDDAQADGFDISDYVANDDSYNRLLGHVSRLPERYRVVFQLRYVHDLSNKEIAERLEESQQTIAAKLHRAKKALIKMSSEEGERVG
jgi:RNA polymerase sigma-70 factor (ECF subfamily)